MTTQPPATVPPPPLNPRERERATTARGIAYRTYPGPLAELICRELDAYLRFGYRTDQAGIVPRLVDWLLQPPGPAPTDLTTAPHSGDTHADP